MTPKEKTLWQKIERFDLDDHDANFSFIDRLCRENGWSIDYAIRAVHEYKKFMFLLCITDGPLTPSDQVDQVWHLHLLYTRSYWLEFCKTILERDIHHGPTKGGKDEKTKYHNLYESTLKRYLDCFKTTPPIDIWPDAKTRFSEINFQRVNKHRFLVIPKIRIRK